MSETPPNPAPPIAAPASAEVPVPVTVRALIDDQSLRTHFQPIALLGDGALYGHEALVRTPPGCPWPNPDALFAAARAEGISVELEIECIRRALQDWAAVPDRAPGRLFLNLSAHALVTLLAQRDIDLLMANSRNLARSADDGIVVELTEHETVRDVDALNAAVGRLRRNRVQLALDDFGDGRSSLRLWSELKPEIVKIDRYFTHDLPHRPEKLQTLRALIQIAQTFGSELIAEGIETVEELHILRDLGVRMGQGWLLGRPQPEPRSAIPAEALAVIGSRDIAVFPERRRATQARSNAWLLLREIPPLSPEASNEQLYERFAADERLRAIAIVDQDRPVGLVGRQRFVDRYSRPYFRELYGRKPCTLFANLQPRTLELNSDVDEMAAVLTSDDQRYLDEGFILTEGGRYRGLGSGEDLVRTVTESRIEAARHANPLTLLPGNIPITQHIARLIASEHEFVACYGDLNQFKPFNDLYGYWRGDEMILLVSRCFTELADPRRDFVGHVGGDDFIALFQSDDWDQRCEQIVDRFNREAMALYDDAARAAGGAMAEDRHGVMRFHPLTTLSIGAVRVGADARRRPEDVANAAADAKRQAKQRSLGVYVLSMPAAG